MQSLFEKAHFTPPEYLCVAVASVPLDKHIYLAFAHMIAVGQQRHDIRNLVAIAEHGLVVVVQINKLHIADADSSLLQPLQRLAIEI